MSARLVSRKPRPYASFVAVSISRVRLSGCAVRIFSGSEELVIQLTQTINPMHPCCQPPRHANFGRWWMVDQSKGVGLNVSYLAKNSTDARSPPTFSPQSIFSRFVNLCLTLTTAQ